MIICYFHLLYLKGDHFQLRCEKSIIMCLMAEFVTCSHSPEYLKLWRESSQKYLVFRMGRCCYSARQTWTFRVGEGKERSENPPRVNNISGEMTMRIAPIGLAKQLKCAAPSFSNVKNNLDKCVFAYAIIIRNLCKEIL